MTYRNNLGKIDISKIGCAVECEICDNNIVCGKLNHVKFGAISECVFTDIVKSRTALEGYLLNLGKRRECTAADCGNTCAYGIRVKEGCARMNEYDSILCKVVYSSVFLNVECGKSCINFEASYVTEDCYSDVSKLCISRKLKCGKSGICECIVTDLDSSVGELKRCKLLTAHECARADLLNRCVDRHGIKSLTILECGNAEVSKIVNDYYALEIFTTLERFISNAV